jgi:hypothetical protein
VQRYVTVLHKTWARTRSCIGNVNVLHRHILVAYIYNEKHTPVRTEYLPVLQLPFRLIKADPFTSSVPEKGKFKAVPMLNKEL